MRRSPSAAQGRAEWNDSEPRGYDEMVALFGRSWKQLGDKVAKLDDAGWTRKGQIIMGGKVAGEQPIGQFLWMPFIITSVLFGFEHREWLAGILCGFTYQGLVCWKKRLGDAVTAHAITNFLLGLWVVHRNAWHFW